MSNDRRRIEKISVPTFIFLSLISKPRGKCLMHVKLGDNEFTFHRIGIELIKSNIQEPFKSFDKKTIRELLKHNRYSHLKESVFNDYEHLLDVPAGQALYELKKVKDPFYMNFLNKYGDLSYCQFVVKGSESLLSKKGVYTIVMDDELVFAGVCNNTFKLRFNQHIGNISPKSCFRDGTATHCHINANIAENISKSTIYFQVCPMIDLDEMKMLKNTIIDRFEPKWNIRFSREMIYSYN